jgi:hypothetical protein
MNTKEATAEYRLHHWSRIIKEQRESGLNIREFCANTEIPEWQYYYWQKRLRETACKEFSKLQTTTELQTSHKFTEVRLFEPPTVTANAGQHHVSVEISGVRLTASLEYPADKLAALLRELVRSC